MGYALTSIVCGIFDVKHYLHLQVWHFLFTNQVLSDNFILSSARSTYFASPSGNDMFLSKF